MPGFHARAAVISSGDEIIVGQLQDSNARWLAQRLVDCGILPVEFATIPDVQLEITAALRRFASRADIDIIVMTGGLGPTDGDLTRPALADLLGEPLVQDADALASLQAMLTSRGRAMNDRQARQAMRPASARCLSNTIGTAPGLHAAIPASQGRTIDLFCLPGPPGELRPMWEKQVAPHLHPQPGRTIRTRLLHMVGVAESDAVIRLGDLTRRTNQPLVGITASGGVLTLRIRFDGQASAGDADRAVAQAEQAARQTLGSHVFGTDGETLAAAVLRECKSRGRVLGSVESCSGGMVGKALTDVPGSSTAYAGGLITYSNDLKANLAGVEPGLIVQHGAVSREVAEAMARGGLEALGVDDCIAITGIAGPDGGSDTKPVGLVWIARAFRAGSAAPGIESRRFLFPGDREDVRTRAVTSALGMLWFGIVGDGPTRLLWERD